MHDMVAEAEHFQSIVNKRGGGLADILQMKRDFDRYVIKVSS